MGKIQKEGVGKIQKEGVGKIQKEGMGEIQKEGVGEIQKEGEGSGICKGMWGKGKGMSGVGMGAAGRGCKRKCSATPSLSPKRHAQPFHTMHHAEGMVECVNKRNAVGIKIRCFYRCKECIFECGTRTACVAHACKKHTNELIGPCNYCGTYYAHSTDLLKHHVNECAGGTTSSYDTDV